MNGKLNQAESDELLNNLLLQIEQIGTIQNRVRQMNAMLNLKLFLNEVYEKGFIDGIEHQNKIITNSKNN